MTASGRLRVDPIACDGRGLCAEMLPELITLDDWGFPVISDEVVPSHLASSARETIRACPKLALRLEAHQAWPSVLDQPRVARPDQPGPAVSRNRERSS